MHVYEFEWDDANAAHLERHGLHPDDVDRMLESRITVMRNKKAGSGDFKFIGLGRGGPSHNDRRQAHGGTRPLASDHGQEE